jgi:hypothetical protein
MRRAHLVVAVAVLLGSLAACGGGDDDSSAPEDDDIQGVEIIRIPPYEHTLADVHYDRSPPAGGAHGAYAAPCAFVDEALPEELYVHAMEHGAVWLAYEPTLPAADLAVLRGLTQEYDDVAASPWDASCAWTRSTTRGSSASSERPATWTRPPRPPSAASSRSPQITIVVDQRSAALRSPMTSKRSSRGARFHVKR